MSSDPTKKDTDGDGYNDKDDSDLWLLTAI